MDRRMNFKEELENRAASAESIIRKYLPAEEGYQKTVIEAMNYSVLAGGKRLRPILMQETYRLFGGEGEVIEPFMAALEMLHTYSLVHDDLPCMDNDEYRRGRKTTHVVYGEGMAVLAGDGLLNYAFETAVKAFEKAGEEECGRVAKALTVFAGKAGIYGMIGGQTADIEAQERDALQAGAADMEAGERDALQAGAADMEAGERGALQAGVADTETGHSGKGELEPVTEELLLFIHKHKTSALIESAMMTGAILAGAKEEEVCRIEECARYIGLAFQIQDDILDITGSLEVLGKAAGSDEKNHKTTYVTIKGMEQAKKEVERLSEEAVSLAASFSGRNAFLEDLIRYLAGREK